MSKSINPISNDQHLKQNTKEIGIISNLFHQIFKFIGFILKNPLKAITFGLAAQTLGSSARAFNKFNKAEADALSVTQELVNYGADIHLKDEHGLTPLDLACLHTQYPSVIPYLESKGARSSFCTSGIGSQQDLPPAANSESTTSFLRI